MVSRPTSGEPSAMLNLPVFFIAARQGSDLTFALSATILLFRNAMYEGF